mmetsp:Transcript_79110/g.201347  ORF Transcript_79110/g.201347 Transcript_79110/m.201347 type:complete len:394 (-) Transcript_79110:30-1211(-)
MRRRRHCHVGAAGVGGLQERESGAVPGDQGGSANRHRACGDWQRSGALPGLGTKAALRRGSRKLCAVDLGCRLCAARPVEGYAEVQLGADDVAQRLHCCHGPPFVHILKQDRDFCIRGVLPELLLCWHGCCCDLWRRARTVAVLRPMLLQHGLRQALLWLPGLPDEVLSLLLCPHGEHTGRSGAGDPPRGRAAGGRGRRGGAAVDAAEHQLLRLWPGALLPRGAARRVARRWEAGDVHAEECSPVCLHDGPGKVLARGPGETRRGILRPVGGRVLPDRRGVLARARGLPRRGEEKQTGLDVEAANVPDRHLAGSAGARFLAWGLGEQVNVANDRQHPEDSAAERNCFLESLIAPSPFAPEWSREHGRPFARGSSSDTLLSPPVRSAGGRARAS